MIVASVAAVVAGSGGDDGSSVAAFGAGLVGSFAVLRWVSIRSGGSLLGIAEPRLTARSEPFQ